MLIFQLFAIFCAKYLIYILLALAAGWLVWRVAAKDQKAVGIFAAISLPLTLLIGRVASLLYHDPRPFVTGHFTPLIAHSASNGFPSDHTLLAAAVACVIWRFDRRFGTGLFGLAVLIGLSRVFVGVHHLQDIIGAIGIAIGAAILTNLILDRRNHNRKAADGSHL